MADTPVPIGSLPKCAGPCAGMGQCAVWTVESWLGLRDVQDTSATFLAADDLF